MKLLTLFPKTAAVVFFTLIFAVSFAFGGKIKILKGPEHHAPDRDYHVIHYTLRLSFNAPNKTLFGKEEITLTPFHSGLDSLVLDAAKMSIQSVRLQSRELKFKKSPKN